MVKLNKIYTRTGDQGTTGLVDGSRISKSDALMRAIGDVDEANSAIGVALTSLDGATSAAQMLSRIQNELFDLGADFATPPDAEHGFAPQPMALRVTASQVERLEQEIDAMNSDLQPLNSFILPGGSVAAAHLHMARAISRRAERAAVETAQTRTLNPVALAYINRISDHLFVMTRFLNDGGASDILWKPGATR